MLASHSGTEHEVERRKSAALAVLRWIDDEIAQAPEPHVKALIDNLALAICKNALEKSTSSGARIAASILGSVDGNRLDCIHMAALHDPGNPDGRKQASEFTVKASKFLTLENMLIDHNLVQLTVVPDPTRIGAQSRYDRGNAARTLLAMLEEMGNSSRAAERNVIKEPIMRALRHTLMAIEANGEQMDVSLALAMQNNANQKMHLSVSPLMQTSPQQNSTAGEHVQ